MRLYVSPMLRPRLNGHTVLDTATMNQEQIQQLYGRLSELAEQPDLVRPEQREEFQDEITALTSTLIDEIELPEDEPVQQITPVVVAQTVAIPHKGAVKNLRANFGTGVHEMMHFEPTSAKAHHGVWGIKKVNKIRKWVRLALDSIYEGDKFVVASKPGDKAGARNYLVFMGTVVGYLSGSSQVNRPQQPVTHIEVYLDAKGNTVSAFPSDPSIF